MAANGNPNEQRLALCDRLRRGHLFAFIESRRTRFVTPDGVVNARRGGACRLSTAARARSTADAWLNGVLNDAIRMARLAELGVQPECAPLLMKGMVAGDPKTGTIQAPVKQDTAAACCPLRLYDAGCNGCDVATALETALLSNVKLEPLKK